MRSSLARRKERRNRARVSLSEHTIIVLAVLDECPYYTSLPSRHLRSRILPWTFSPAVPTVLRDPAFFLPRRIVESSLLFIFLFPLCFSFSLVFFVPRARPSRGAKVCPSIIIAPSCHSLPSLCRFVEVCDATRICGGLRWPG